MACRTLPPELVADILDDFILLFPSHAARLPNLASFARVDKAWAPIATSHLYRNLYLDSKSRSAILSSLEADPALAPLVRTLTLSGGKLDEAEFARLRSVLQGCKNVTSLSYHCFDAQYLGDLTAFIGEAWPGLRYLRADQSQHLFDLLGRLPSLEELIASHVDFPAAAQAQALAAASLVPLPLSRPSTPSAAPARPARPTFKLRRFDSGSSPSPLNFHLLTSSSRHTLRSLDLPISSVAAQDLSAFSALTSLTLTLAERYLPADADLPARAPGRPGSGRNDPRCLRRLKDVLRAAEAGSVPLKTLEIYEPHYAATSPFSAAAFAASDFLAAVPAGVEELELQTCAVPLAYLSEALARVDREPQDADDDGEEREERAVCRGLRRVTLGRGSVGGATETQVRELLEVAARRGVSVRWA
ncbi:hypothetical protein JCM10213_005333 [Rhodosporidiobolus nylandii]